ncbi:ABC transporter permease [Algoriphagus sp.]|uniref:ABC transporter permease n=1 Tax=Algoriphagus sp. TaxID=1872435 RepID=UPI0026343334|nr:ABC transporter permease [Algoriphagus sp.]
MKNRAYTLINFIGLSVGVAVATLLFFYIQFQVSFDSFHPEKNSLYRVLRVQNGDQGEFRFPSLPLVLESVIEQNLSDRVDYTHFIPNNFLVKRPNGDGFNQSTTMVSTDFFEMFGFNMLQGSYPQTREQRNGIVVSESTAIRFFGTENPIGQELQIRLTDELLNFEVIGLIEDAPANSSLSYELLMHDSNLELLYPERMRTHWYMSFGDGFAKLKGGMSPMDFETETKDFVRRTFQDPQEAENYGFALQGITDMHLNAEIPTGIASVINPRILWILGGISVLIILIACINFTTMAIGNSASRAKEVGVRKTMGAGSRQLFEQFMSESIILTSSALILGLILSLLFLPVFNSLMQTQLEINFSLDQFLIIGLTGIVIALLAGSYPALFLASFRPIQVLKSTVGIKLGKQNLRMTMLGFQFFISMVLITCTLVMVKQMRTVEEYDLGAVRSDILQITVPPPAAQGLGDAISKSFEYAQPFKNELRKLPEVTGVTVATAMYGDNSWFSAGFREDESKPGIDFHLNIVDEDFVEFFGLKVLEGRNFSAMTPSDLNSAFLMNEQMKKTLGWEDVFGKSLVSLNGFGQNSAIGVVEDFHYESLYQPVEPAILVMKPENFFKGMRNLTMEDQMTGKIFVKLSSQDKQAVVATLAGIWKELYGSDPFDYQYVEDQIAQEYVLANSLSSLVSVASVVALIIAGMGLFAMASLAISSRMKEIGIRRVMGATTTEISLLFNKQFIRITLIGVIISIPFSFYLMSIWLEDFAVKTTIGAGVFLVALIIGVAFSVAIVSVETIKSTWVNPTKLLRSE